jgi:hypothetical protein
MTDQQTPAGDANPSARRSRARPAAAGDARRSASAAGNRDAQPSTAGHGSGDAPRTPAARKATDSNSRVSRRRKAADTAPVPAARKATDPTRGGRADARAPSRKLPAKDTAEGKRQRWERYQKRVGSPAHQAAVRDGKKQKPLSYDGWSKKYDVAINQPGRADAAVNDYASRKRMSGERGWFKDEKTKKTTSEFGWRKEHRVATEHGERRIDLAHPRKRHAIEYKSGTVPNDAKTHAQIRCDSELIRRRWTVKWVFKIEPAKWLKDQLASHGIPWERDHG